MEGFFKMSAKSMFIDCLISAKKVVSDSRGDAQKTNYLTYITSSGIVVGRKLEVNSVDVDDVDLLEQEIVRREAENNPVTTIDLADGMFIQLVKESTKSFDTDNKSIVLEDVQIMTEQKAVIRSEVFVLFTDQIVGIVPGRIDLHQL